MAKKIIGIILFAFFLITECMVFHAYAQESSSQEVEETEKAIDDEFRWLQEEAIEFVSVATKTRMDTQKAPSVVSVITGEQIRNMGARDIIDVLRTVPGFDMIPSAQFSITRTGIRGMYSGAWNDKMKTMIDGHHIQAAEGHAFQHFDRLPIASIRQIEIIRGPGSALYGSNAFLGVVNIITKEGGDEPSEISLEYGSFDTVKPYAELSYT